MALILHPPSSSSSFLTTDKPLLLHKPSHLKPLIFRIKSRQDSSTEEASSTKKGGNSSPGTGFGASAAAPAKKKGKERASIIRREPVEKPSFAAAQDGARAEEMSKNESTFLLAWLGLGGIILIEGLALAVSGFLPEAWDKLISKYLYPSFTPTVFLFVAGTTAYGVLKYLQNEKSQSQN